MLTFYFNTQGLLQLVLTHLPSILLLHIGEKIHDALKILFLEVKLETELAYKENGNKSKLMS